MILRRTCMRLYERDLTLVFIVLLISAVDSRQDGFRRQLLLCKADWAPRASKSEPWPYALCQAVRKTQRKCVHEEPRDSAKRFSVCGSAALVVGVSVSQCIFNYTIPPKSSIHNIQNSARTMPTSCHNRQSNSWHYQAKKRLTCTTVRTKRSSSLEKGIPAGVFQPPSVVARFYNSHGCRAKVFLVYRQTVGARHLGTVAQGVVKCCPRPRYASLLRLTQKTKIVDTCVPVPRYYRRLHMRLFFFP